MVKNKENYSIEVLFPQDLIQRRIREMALRITNDYEDKNTLIIAVLKGSFVFCADLIRNLNFVFAFDFISLSSYCGTATDGNVKVISNLKEDPEGRDVIVIEDIADTGHTLDFLHKELAAKNPRSISTCVLLDKKCARVKNVPIEYAGFEIGNDFVIGYGLDYNGFFRGLPYIGILRLNSENQEK
jgi:hypoxanthine phosphoribosyltransferase